MGRNPSDKHSACSHPFAILFTAWLHRDTKLGSRLHPLSLYGGPTHTAEMDARAREKEKLFIELYRLDDADDDKNDPSPFKNFTYHPSSSSLTTTSSESIQRAPHPLSRTVSAPSNSATSPPSPTTSILENTPSSSPVHYSNIKMSTKKPSATNQSFPVSKGSRKTAEIGTKRKRAESFKELPESQKFFTGLLFCEFDSKRTSMV